MLRQRDDGCPQSCMDRSRAFSVGVALRCFATIERDADAIGADRFKMDRTVTLTLNSSNVCLTWRRPGQVIQSLRRAGAIGRLLRVPGRFLRIVGGGLRNRCGWLGSKIGPCQKNFLQILIGPQKSLH